MWDWKRRQDVPTSRPSGMLATHLLQEGLSLRVTWAGLLTLAQATVKGLLSCSCPGASWTSSLGCRQQSGTRPGTLDLFSAHSRNRCMGAAGPGGWGDLLARGMPAKSRFQTHSNWISLEFRKKLSEEFCHSEVIYFPLNDKSISNQYCQ